MFANDPNQIQNPNLPIPDFVERIHVNAGNPHTNESQQNNNAIPVTQNVSPVVPPVDMPHTSGEPSIQPPAAIIIAPNMPTIEMPMPAEASSN